MLRLLLVLAVALLTSGCAGLVGLALAVDAVVGGVGIYQRHEDRSEQQAQTEAIKKLTKEIARLRIIEKRRLESGE